MITLGFNNGQKVASIVQEDDMGFKTCTSLLKNQKFQWNPNNRWWEKSAIFYSNDLFDILSSMAKVFAF